MLLCLVRQGPVHGPADRNIREREAELAGTVRAVVADQIDLDKTRHRVVPRGSGTDRDLGLQQGSGLGVGTAMRQNLRP